VSEGEPLTGDGVTQGIVRIGNTVRRPLRPFSLTVQAYLAHLRDAGFTGAPLSLGVDEQGREVLSYVPGDVPRNPLPPETAGDDVLVALARLIRALHEASAGWVPPPDAVWYWAPLRDPQDRGPRSRTPTSRVAVFADAYGMTARHRAELAPFAVDLARRYHEDARASAELDPVFRKLWEDGAKDVLPRAEAWPRAAAPAITARLTRPG
jgi:hypothetical protein